MNLREFRKDRNWNICIDRANGMTMSELSKKYDLDKSHVRRIVNAGGSGGIHREVVAARDERDKRIAEDRKSGMLLREIAAKYGMTSNAISIVLRKFGLNKSHKGGPKPDPAVAERNKQIAYDYEHTGLTAKAIAAKYGLYETSIYDIVKLHTDYRRDNYDNHCRNLFS